MEAYGGQWESMGPMGESTGTYGGLWGHRLWGEPLRGHPMETDVRGSAALQGRFAPTGSAVSAAPAHAVPLGPGSHGDGEGPARSVPL